MIDRSEKALMLSEFEIDENDVFFSGSSTSNKEKGLTKSVYFVYNCSF